MPLANPSSTLTEIVTTTLRSRTGKLADNVTKNDALLDRLKKKGNVKPVSGGRTIVQELEYAENGTVQSYSGYEALNIAPSDVFTGAEYNYAQYAVAVSISGLEMIQNSGKEAIIDLLSSRIKNAEKSLANRISIDLYGDGTGNGGRNINGLALLVSSTPTTGVVGGIDASTSIGSFWRNIAYSGVTNGGSATSSANIANYMNAVTNQLVRGRDRTDLIIADTNYYNFYLQSLQSIQRIEKTDMAGIGFTSLKFYGGGGDADVVLDGGFGGGCPANTMYFLNTDYLFFRPHTERNFAPLGEDRFAVNQDAMVKLIGFAGNATVSNRRLQGTLGA